MSETVSVIVPCYKVEPYLRRCVDSILRQSYHDLEVILIDDGSPDRCGEICDGYAAVDTRVRVIHQSNRGLSEARNAGLDLMTGTFVTFVDGDDWLADTCVETLHELLIDSDADISACGMLLTSDDRNVPLPEDGLVRRLGRVEAIDHVLKRRKTSMVAACGKLYRADLFDGIRFPAGRLHEDAFTTYKVILKAQTIALTTSPQYYYYQRPDSITGSPFNSKAKLDIIDALTERSRILRHEGMYTAAAISSGQVLATYMELVERAASDPPHPGVRSLNLRALARQLRAEVQPLKFRAFYTVAAPAPTVAWGIYSHLRS